jgi:hypothetical protein
MTKVGFAAKKVEEGFGAKQRAWQQHWGKKFIVRSSSMRAV